YNIIEHKTGILKMLNAVYSITNLERRCCARLPVKYLAQLANGNKNIYATVVNISEKGLGIRIPHCLIIGDRINMKVNCYFSFGNNILEQFYVYLKVQVVWVLEESENVYLVGLKILDSYNDSIHKLKNHLQILFLQNAFNNP
ncbi:MAG: PilZ domain-containing protein, partial [Candidatus Aureabacteria bacterium]|nr:PilZ domain-containing protein [Candidatus Auribacterota bacterium]